jgi:ankyrin repeat protein
MKKIILLVLAAALIAACKTLPRAETNIYNALHDAVLNNDTSAFNKTVYDTDPSVIRRVINQVDSRGRTLLHIAVGNAQTGMTSLLLRNGSDPNAVDSNGQTPLHIAVLNQAANIVSALVENRADKSITDRNRKTPEDYAWELNNLAILNILNGNQSPVLAANTQSPSEPAAAPEQKNTPPAPAASPAAVPKTFIPPVSGAYSVSLGASKTDFLAAVKKGDYTKVEKQLGLGQKPNDTDTLGNSALLHAIDGENLAMVQLLVEHGANVNQANSRKQTPLLYAVAKNNYAIAETLASAGASVNQADAEGITPLWLAVQNKNAPLVLYLVTRGARVNDQDREGNSVLLIAAANNDVQMVKALIQNRADPYASNQSGITPLDVLKASPREELRQLAAGL